MRNIDCSDVIQIFAPLFRPVMLELACMKYFIVLEAVKNRRVDSPFVFLSHKFFGKEMMHLPSLRSLECHVGICSELLKILYDAENISSDMFSCPPHGHT